MKQAKPTQHKKRKESLYGVMDGWNFGIGFWLALPVVSLLIIPIITIILWLILTIFGSVLGGLL